MIGAIPLGSYALEVDRLNLEYDSRLFDESRQKEYYKQINGYKIAWNWVNRKNDFFPIYERRVERNRAQAIYRLTRRFDISFLNDLREGNSQDFRVVRTLFSGPYWLFGASSFITWLDNAENAGIDVVFGLWDSESQAQKTYRTSLQREIAIRDIIRQCGSWQRKDNDSGLPFIEFRSGIVKNTNNLTYFNLIVNRK